MQNHYKQSIEIKFNIKAKSEKYRGKKHYIMFAKKIAKNAKDKKMEENCKHFYSGEYLLIKKYL